MCPVRTVTYVSGGSSFVLLKATLTREGMGASLCVPRTAFDGSPLRGSVEAR